MRAGLERRRRAGAGRPGRHLFSGLLKCGECGSSFTLASRTYYAYAGYLNGKACSDSIHVRRELIETRILDALRASLRDPTVISEATCRARKLLSERRTAQHIDQLRVVTMRAEIEHLADAIASGLCRRSPIPARRLADAEAELSRLEEAAAKPYQVVQIAPGLPERLRAAVERLDRTFCGPPTPNALGGR